MARNDVRFTLICLTLFLFGAYLRLRAGWSPFPSTATASTLPISEQSDVSLAELDETVLDFYKLVDNGNYQAAYQLSLENKWREVGEDEYVAAGLTSEEEFVETLSNEIGSNGMGLNIIAIDIVEAALLPSDRWKLEEWPELLTLNSLPRKAKVQGVYEVEVAGVLLGRCSRWEWRDRVLVARMQGGDWKLLLPGSPSLTSPHHEEWFLDRYPLKGKRVALGDVE